MMKRTALKLVWPRRCGDARGLRRQTKHPKGLPHRKDRCRSADKAAGPYKVAFVYVSPASEEGWSRQHDLAHRARKGIWRQK